MHLLNPGYAKNQEKIEERFRILIHAKDDLNSGIKSGMSAKERARSLVDSGSPNLDRRKADQKSEIVLTSTTNLDSDDDDDETSFGIIPTSKLRKDEMARDRGLKPTNNMEGMA